MNENQDHFEKITKIEKDHLEIETNMGIIQININDSTLIKSTSTVRKGSEVIGSA